MNLDNSKLLSRQTVGLIDDLLRSLVKHCLVTPEEWQYVSRNLLALSKTGEFAKPPDPKLISRNAASEMLDISESEFRRLESNGAFPFRRVKIGNKTVRYRYRDLVDFIEAERDGNGQLPVDN